MIKPFGNMVLLQKEASGEKKTSSGLVISAGFDESGIKRGLVIDYGDGEYNYKGDLIPLNGIEEGDTVMYQEHSAIEVEDTDGTKYHLINAKNILAKAE